VASEIKTHCTKCKSEWELYDSLVKPEIFKDKIRIHSICLSCGLVERISIERDDVVL